MRYELKSLGIWSFTKVSFFINLVIGFILGLLYAILLPVMVSMAELGGFPGGAMNPSEVSFTAMLVILPIMCSLFAAVFHTMIGVLLVAVYNLIVRMMGGLEFDLDPVKQARSATPVRPRAALATVDEAAVSVPPVHEPPPRRTTPPPPPPVPGVSSEAAPVADPTPPRPATDMPELSAAPPFQPTTTEIESPSPVVRPKPTEEETKDDPPSAPETT
ncbi:MAG: DUF3566 domain-containing protein [candidate division Zixibacteria bacterium]|nr:DUF3566 domain-containing protein [candidate division Zixibacteria bacterium]MDH4033723.1 DUF3566 domain-containing protein [candidate division Zixibacteria bacterium]